MAHEHAGRIAKRIPQPIISVASCHTADGSRRCAPNPSYGAKPRNARTARATARVSSRVMAGDRKKRRPDASVTRGSKLLSGGPTSITSKPAISPSATSMVLRGRKNSFRSNRARPVVLSNTQVALCGNIAPSCTTSRCGVCSTIHSILPSVRRGPPPVTAIVGWVERQRNPFYVAASRPFFVNIASNSSFERRSPSAVSPTDFALLTGLSIMPFSCRRFSASQSKLFQARYPSWSVRRSSASTASSIRSSSSVMGLPLHCFRNGSRCLRRPSLCPRHPPRQSRESGKIAIESDPLTPPFDRQRREPGVGHAHAGGLGLDAETLEDVPMALAGLDNLAVRLTDKVVAEPEGLGDRARHLERPRIGGDPDQRAQHRGRDAETRVALDHVGQPASGNRVLRHVLAKRIDQHVDVRQNHFRASFARHTRDRRPPEARKDP